MKMIRSFFIAFSTYSKIPMPQFEWKKEDMQYVLLFFPWVGIVIGLLDFLWMWFCKIYSINPLCHSCVLAAIPLLVTGGFHVDGFMDTMDAIHSYQSRERKLEILKDSHIGAFAVITLMVYMLLYVAAGSLITDLHAVAVLGCGFFLSRVLSGLSLVFWKAAKQNGSLYVVQDAADRIRMRWLLSIQGILVIAVMLFINWRLAIVVCVAAGISFLYYRYESLKSFGGITGDVAGCFVTICECAMIVAVGVSSVLM